MSDGKPQFPLFQFLSLSLSGHTHIYTHAHTHTRTYARTHIHLHIHTRTFSRTQRTYARTRTYIMLQTDQMVWKMKTKYHNVITLNLVFLLKQFYSLIIKVMGTFSYVNILSILSLSLALSTYTQT